MKNGPNTTVIVGASIFLLGLIASVAAMVFPEWEEYNKVVEAIDATVADPSLKDASVAQVREAYARRASSSSFTSVSPQDLDITKVGGQLVISAAYSKKLPIWGDVTWPVTSKASK